MKLKLSVSVIEWKFIVTDIYDEWILRLDLMKKYGQIVDLKSGLLKTPHGDIPLPAMETFAIQQVRREVDSVQELVKACKEILLAEQIENLKKTMLDYHDVFVMISDKPVIVYPKFLENFLFF